MLILNSKTNINVVNNEAEELTIAMKSAYEPNFGINMVDKLLTLRPDDLDINILRANIVGVKGYTLLDIVVSNCMTIPMGHDDQQRKTIETNKKWLDILKKMCTHSMASVTNHNIEKAQEYVEKLDRSTSSQEAKKIAEQALEILKNSKK